MELIIELIIYLVYPIIGVYATREDERKVENYVNESNLGCNGRERSGRGLWMDTEQLMLGLGRCPCRYETGA
jgi:hypothetical protein